MKKYCKSFYFISLSLCLLACKKEDKSAPDASPTGSFSFYRNEVLINADVYAPRPIFNFNPNNRQAGYFGTLSISGDTVKSVYIGSWKIVTPGDTVQLFFQINKKPKKGGIVQGMTLPIVPFWESVLLSEPDAWVYYADNSLAGKGYSIHTASGSLHLEKLDVINKKASGTFHCTFTGTRPGNSDLSIQIKNGTFKDITVK